LAISRKHPKIIEHENISCLSVDLAVEADVAVENFFLSWKTVDAIVHNAGLVNKPLLT
jgi:NADP-dependent 3-hydroxy acid dehydrogenase YdfG